MRVQIPRVGLHEALYCGTIATLPLFAVRGIPGGISLPLAFMLLMVVAIGLRAVLTSQLDDLDPAECILCAACVPEIMIGDDSFASFERGTEDPAVLYEARAA